MPDHDGIALLGFEVNRGIVKYPDGPYLNHKFNDEHTVTLTGRHPWGVVTIEAIATGTDGEAAAGWKACWHLMAAPAGTTEQTWVRATGGEWVMTKPTPDNLPRRPEVFTGADGGALDPDLGWMDVAGPISPDPDDPSRET